MQFASVKLILGGDFVTKRILSILIITMLVVFAGCGKKSNSFDTANPVTPSQSAGMEYPKSEEKDSSYDSATNQNTIPQKKKIIQNFLVYLTVEDIKTAVKEISSKTSQLGGYTEMEEVTEYGSSSIIRIPSSKTDEFIDHLEKIYEVTNKQKSIEDITNVYVDNDARLKNLKAEESQVLEIMKKANTVEEILKVQSELYKIREEIEVLESRKKNWDRQVDYSTIRLNISKKQIVADRKIKILTSNEFFSSAWQGFKNTFTSIVLSLQKLIIFIFSNLIPIGIIGGIVYAGYRILVKKKNNL